jgi:hypothetical protein
MDTNLSTNIIQDELDTRRSGDERRDESDRRRSASGLFELRARREAPTGDRRSSRRDRRDSLWARFAFWRRDKVGTEPIV